MITYAYFQMSHAYGQSWGFDGSWYLESMEKRVITKEALRSIRSKYHPDGEMPVCHCEPEH